VPHSISWAVFSSTFPPMYHVRVSCSLRLHPHTCCSRFEPMMNRLTKIPYSTTAPQVLRKNYGVFLSMELRARRHSPTRRHRSAASLGPSWAWAVKTTRSRFPTSQPASRSGMAWCAPPLGRRSNISRWLENIPEEATPSRCDAEGDPLLPTPVGSLARHLSFSFLLPAAIDDRRSRCPSTTSTWP